MKYFTRTITTYEYTFAKLVYDDTGTMVLEAVAPVATAVKMGDRAKKEYCRLTGADVCTGCKEIQQTRRMSYDTFMANSEIVID